MNPIPLPQSHRDLFDGDACVALTTVMPDEQPQITPNRRQVNPARATTRVRPYYGRAWQAASWHSRGDGLSSPWGGAATLA